MKNQLIFSNSQKYSPAVYLDRIWSINADENYIREFGMKKNDVNVYDYEHESASRIDLFVAIRTRGGEGILELKGHTFILHENSLIIFNINQPKCYYTSKIKWSFTWFEFRIDYNILDTEKIILCQISRDEKFLVAKCAEELGTANGIKYASALFSALVVYWQKNSAKYIIEKQKNIENLVNYIEKEYSNQELTVKQLADRAAMSERHFRTLFHHFTGISPAAFINNKRLVVSQELLSNSDMPIYEIAQKVGFNDQYYFSTAFKKKFGISPKAFRTT